MTIDAFSVFATVGFAVFFVYFTVSSGVTCNTEALVSTIKVVTRSTILAWLICSTLVNINMTIATAPAIFAIAKIVIYFVNTSWSVFTFIFCTVIDVYFAVGSSPSWGTFTFFFTGSGWKARTTIDTGIFAAVVNFYITVSSRPTAVTFTNITAFDIFASSILKWIFWTWLDEGRNGT